MGGTEGKEEEDPATAAAQEKKVTYEKKVSSLLAWIATAAGRLRRLAADVRTRQEDRNAAMAAALTLLQAMADVETEHSSRCASVRPCRRPPLGFANDELEYHAGEPVADGTPSQRRRTRDAAYGGGRCAGRVGYAAPAAT